MVNVIKFPGLGLELNINKVFLSFGNVSIYWYGFLIVFAFLVGLLLLRKLAKESNFNFENILELFILIVPVSIICARLYYILFNLDYYLSDISRMFSITTGGLAIYGGIIGGVIVSFIYTKIKKINFIKLLDMLVIVLPLGQAIGRWGNFFNVEAYGSVTNSFLRMGIFENGNYIEVHPTFLYESLICLTIFGILYFTRNKKKFVGENVCIYFLLYGISRTFIEGLRTDSLMIGTLKVSQIISILLVIFAKELLIDYLFLSATTLSTIFCGACSYLENSNLNIPRP